MKNENSYLVIGVIELLQNLIKFFNRMEVNNQKKGKISSILDSSDIKFIKDGIVKFYSMNNLLANSMDEPNVNLKKFFSNFFINYVEEKNTISIEKVIIINIIYLILIIIKISACRMLNNELADIINFFGRSNFKLLKIFESSNFKIIWTVFVKDFQKFFFLKEKVLNECT